ncbi:MAG: hypothetical protein CVV33_00765 [Methanomicrobiales archaeon HGW-Methanomicrobiales-4]|nr:MAG: hypothetical protein CVV33_00765 [Methanomicrobiales archaeon HGW-Methanomicrobiales-4]
MNDSVYLGSNSSQILVVDDTPASLKLLTDILTNNGYHVRPATNGKLALRTVEAELPDLILLDVLMPDMDGYEVCKILKNNERTRGIPVIFISSLEQPADRVKGFQVGAVDFISKPIDPPEMLSRVHTHLSLRHLQNLLEAQNLRLEEEIIEREQKEDELQQYKESLEITVLERTKKIQEINRTLELQNVILATQQESSIDGILTVDEQGNILSINGRFKEIFTLPLDITISRFDILISEYLQNFFSRTSTDIQEILSLENQSDTRNPEEYSLVDGRTIELYSSPMIDIEGTHFGKVWFFRDITKRKNMENLLREKTDELDRFFSLNLDLLCIASDEGYFLRLNPEWEHVLGYSLEFLMSKQYVYFVHPEDLAITRKKADISREERVFRFINRYRHKNGTYRWIEWNSVPYGNLIYASARDISDRIIAEHGLRESEERFRTMIEQSPLSIQIMAPDGRTVQINRAFEELWGINLSDLKEYNILSDQQLVEIGLMEYIRRGFAGESISIPPAQYDVIKSVGKGDKRWVQSRIYPVRDGAGKIINIILVHEDISEKKQVTEALSLSEEKYRTLVENIHVGVYQIQADQRGDFLWVNHAMVTVFGYDSPEELIQISVIDLYVYPEKRKIYLEKILKEGFVRDYVIQMKKRDGTQIWVSVTSHVRYEPDGTIQCIDGILEDITAYYHIEELKWKAFSQIERNMEQFAILNDQIRNPLSIILSYVSESELPEKNIIEQQVKRIDDLIDQLDKGYVESEKVSLFLRKHRPEML